MARRTLPAMAAEVGVVPDVVDMLDNVSVELTDRLLRETGLVPPPTVHILSRLLAPPYLGKVSTRPFYRGEDAALAVTALGLLPSRLLATHLVVVWEYADLCTALELPGEAFPTGVVVLEASTDSHVVRWHPFRVHVGLPGPLGLPTVRAEWGELARFADAPLPAPVVELLAVWRSWQGGNYRETAAGLERAGFKVWWAPRDGWTPPTS